MREGQALGVQSVALQDLCLTQGPNTCTQNILKNTENVTGASDLTTDLFGEASLQVCRATFRDYLPMELESGRSRSKG